MASGYLDCMRLSLAMFTVLLGLASREKPLFYLLPDTTGDALYAVLMVLLVGELASRQSARRVAVVGFLLCVLVELSQLWRTEWLDAARATTFGKLVLGRGFVWRDIVAYAIGATLGGWFEARLRARNAASRLENRLEMVPNRR